MKRVLSGIQPSGVLHIGNYFAMMKPMIELQESSELYCFIADYHAMTSMKDPSLLNENVVNAAADFLALGLDPEKCCFWIQSDVPEVQELTWILSCNTTLGYLERSHSYKDKIAKGLTPNTGLFTYPVLMAADILLYQSEIVPVGKDQKQHVEITRDIAQSFNNTYGETFVIPEPKIENNVAVIPGTDGQKMSKSYGNTIEIFEDEKLLKKKVMKIMTDSKEMDEPKDPDSCNVFALYKLFASENQQADMRKRYIEGGLGYGTAKKELLDLIIAYFKEYKVKRNDLLENKDEILKIMSKGAEKARESAYNTLSLAKEKVGLKYR